MAFGNSLHKNNNRVGGRLWWRSTGSLLAIAVVIVFSPIHAAGAGFALLQQSTQAMAQGNAFVASADDASAIFYNPAGLNQLKRTQVYNGIFLNHPDRDFDGQGVHSETNHRWYRNMTIFIAGPAHERVALGVGFFSPFGLGTAWPPEWAGRYLTTFSTLKTYVLNPTISIKPLDNLSIGAGFDVIWSSVELKRKVPVIVQGRALPDAEVMLTGDGHGYGYNLGLLYEPVTGVKLGVSYRSEMQVDHVGELTSKLPVPVPTFSNFGAASLTFPPSVTFGASYSRLKPFTFEFDTTWTGWSTFDEVKIRLNTLTLVNGIPSNTIVTPKHWHDAWAFRFGANYEIREGMKIRAGYIYDLTPVPDSTFDPQIPDANRHIFTVGGDVRIKRFILGIAYNYILSETRDKNNFITFNGVPAPLQANGRYRSDVHSIGLSWAFNF